MKTTSPLALSYLRVSSIGQLDGDGLERQDVAIRKYAKASGHAIAEAFYEEGVSGTMDGCDRPALSRLFQVLKDRPEIKTIICERADRIGRSLIVSEVILQSFRALGVAVIAAEGGTNLTDDSSADKVLIRQILGAVAHFDRSIVVSKLKAARDRKSLSQGKGKRIEGRKAYGEKNGEDVIVARIHSLRRKRQGRRLSFAEIARQLDAEGLATRCGGKWDASVVYRIIQRRKAA